MRLTLRSALVLAAILLLAGATTSFAQAIFTASAGNPPMRIGSQSETAGDIALTSTNGFLAGAFTSPLQMVFTYSVPITNKTLRSQNIANNCAVGANASIVLPADATVGVAGLQMTINNITCSAVALISWTASGTTLTLNFGNAVGGAAITYTFGTVVGNTNIQLHGARLNLATLGVPPSVSMLTVFVNTAPSLNLQLAAGSTSLTVGTVANALDTSSTNKTRVVGSSTNSQDAIFQITGVTANIPASIGAGNLSAITVQPVTSFSSCSVNTTPQSGAANPIVTGGNSNTDRSGNANFRNAVGIRVTEAYSGAFTSRFDEGNKSNIAEVDAGIRLRIDITGLPAQVSIAALQRIAPAGLTAVPPYPVNTPSGQASSGLVLDLVSSTCFSNTVVGGTCGGAGPVTTEIRANASGSITFEYEVINNTPSAPGVPSSAVIPLWVFASATPTDLGTANISIRMSPINGSSILRFTDAQSAVTGTVAFNTCNTDLYFPFVTNQVGFDTGIAVINGGQSGSTNTGQSGACTAKFYDGSTSGKTAVKSTALPSIGPGAMTVFVVSDSTLGKPGFQGTLHVSCPFQRAHGYAYVTFGFGSAPVGSAPPGTSYIALNSDGDNTSTR